MTERPWVVLKFGGTSVASAARWQTIAQLAEKRLAEGLRPLIVCSAVAGVSNRLEKLAGLAAQGRHEETLTDLRQRHLELGAELGLDAAGILGPQLDELARLALGAALLGEAGPSVAARMMAMGELLSTRLGAAFLNARGLATGWLDARTALTSLSSPLASPARAYLAAACAAEPDPELVARLAALPEAVILTQGFIAASPTGDTVLLGRGGSDTSAAYFAAKLQAVRCEIWTDVPGMFTANPALLPSARLLRALDYDEAQEIATTGAKVLHPRSIPPLKRHGIPLHVLSTARPEAPGTVISAAGSDGDPQVKAISSRRGIVLVSMETASMWQEVGFLADVFTCFARHGVSVDAISTSETNVTVSLDPTASGTGTVDAAALDGLLADLAVHCEPRLIAPTASISLVGPGIRAILHELGHLLEVFEELRVYLLTQSASDLNLTFFVDEEQSERLVRQLHGLLFGHRAEGPVLGPTWADLQGAEAGQTQAAVWGASQAPAVAGAPNWWQERRTELLALAADRGPLYVYDPASLETAARALTGLAAVDRVFYSVKANHHPGVLATLEAAGLGFECVSVEEIELLRDLFPTLAADRVLYTPNFASREEIARGFALGARVTIDGLHPLEAWPDLFAGRDLFLRLDPGRGRGHHAHVRTAGVQSKFGIAPEQLGRAAERVAACGARVVGLHAHAGSGIRTAENWGELAVFLGSMRALFPDVRVLDVGGGLAVPERQGQSPLDLAVLDAALARFREAQPVPELWLEPGRFLVAEAGVLLARVNQIKQKGGVTYVGVETGMNSLIRPALYGAYHPITNLTRLGEPTTLVAHVVGPICETGDVLGRARRLAPTAEGDVLLIANAGAYGRVMSSSYNLRPPAGEHLLVRR